ncbi:hypothetical protein RSOLAG22IIIB_03850 [Rhizoctonia solani]|uniref:Uncharacterized protein n=1 Tax=Rhizoctonia solani TaxID=456999 RepID=A0A0K6FSB9_9AGAM|nr:unnamed protein product [Rhizoctonia solani]CUA69170.1 hypothetical protein RSOLAG22IIIB_03850 [Rhizoctonia solani]
MCFERASGIRYRLCGCVEILEVEFVDCLLPSCRQSICHPEDCQGILCPCTIQLGPRVLLVKPPANRRCDKCEKLQSIIPLPIKAQRSRHKRDTRERHPARQPCEVIYEVPRASKPKAIKTRTKDVDRPKVKDSRRPLGVSNSKSAQDSPTATQTPGTVPSMQPSLPPRPSNPYPSSSTSSQTSSGIRLPTSKTTPVPSKFPSVPPSTPASVFSLPIIPDPSTRPASNRTSPTLSSLGSVTKTGTSGQPLPSIPWPSTAAPTRNGTPANESYYAPLDPLGSPSPYLPLSASSPHSYTSMSSRSWRTATQSTTESNPRSVDGSGTDYQAQSEASSQTRSWKRTGLSRPIDGSTPLEPLPFPSTPAPPPSERRSSFTSASTRPRVVAAPFISQPTTPSNLSPCSQSKSSSQFPTSPTPNPKRPKLGWTASSLMAVLPRVPSRSLKSSSGREASPVFIEHPTSPLTSEISSQPQPRPRRSFLRNPWK